MDKKPLHEFMFAELKVVLKKLKLPASGNKAGYQNISNRFQLLVCGNEPRRPRYPRRREEKVEQIQHVATKGLIL